MIKKNIYIGWDIGGAHTKYTVSFESKDVVECRIIHCELWKSLSKLEDIIENVKLSDERSRNKGVSGVPFFIVNDNYAVSGAQESEVFEKIFETCLLENKIN